MLSFPCTADRRQNHHHPLKVLRPQLTCSIPELVSPFEGVQNLLESEGHRGTKLFSSLGSGDYIIAERQLPGANQHGSQLILGAVFVCKHVAFHPLPRIHFGSLRGKEGISTKPPAVQRHPALTKWLK